jgi:ornithine cyclodeaminase/alanine dehydrogenase
MSFKGKTVTSDDLFRNIKLLTSNDIKDLVSMNDAVQAMQQAFASYSSGKSQVPQRYVAAFKETNMDLFLKPAYSKVLGKAAIKILTQNNMKEQRDIPSILGVVLLIDMGTGATLAMMDGAYITALRTGAASGLATKCLALRNAETLAIFGCGAQAKTQFEAISTVRSIKKVLLYDINLNAANELKKYICSKEKVTVQIQTDLKDLKQAEIICMVTNAESPLFSPDDISKGVHINAIGSYKPNMQEIDPRILKEGLLFVDSRESVLKESGDLIKPINNKIFTSEIIKAEIGDLLNGKALGRQTQEEITIFKSVGLGVQDLYMANKIFESYTITLMAQ